MTHTRVHTHVSLANPHLRCRECREPVRAIHDPARCGCEGEFHNVPCRHLGLVSACPSWGPVDGCRCSTPCAAERQAAPVAVTE